MEKTNVTPKFVVIFSIIPPGAKEDKLGTAFEKMIKEYSPDATYKMICNQDIRTRAEEEYKEMNGVDGDIEKNPDHKIEFRNFIKEMTTLLFQEEVERITEFNEDPSNEEKIKVHFILFSKHCPLNHFNNNLELIKPAFPKGFYKVALIQTPAPCYSINYSENSSQESQKNDPLKSPYSYATRFKSFEFPLTLHNMICSLYSTLVKVKKKNTSKRLQTVVDRVGSFKGIMFNFTRDNYTPKNYSRMGFDLVLEFEFFDQNCLSVKNYSSLKKTMDKIFKINERKFVDSFEDAANDLIDSLNSNIMLEGRDAWKIRDFGKDEEIPEDREFVMNWESDKNLVLIENLVFQPLRKKFGFRDIREELDAAGN